MRATDLAAPAPLSCLDFQRYDQPASREIIRLARRDREELRIEFNPSDWRRDHPAYKNKRRTLSREPKAIRELRLQLHDMRTAAKPFLTNEARKVYWAQAWELTVVHAATRVESNRKEFYGLRLAAIISAITVPSLVGLNLSGTGGSAVRWLTFALSLIAALSTAILTLFRFADRWVMYRALSNGLMSAGWALVNSPDTEPDAWTRFTTATDTAKASYNATYQRAVILAAEPKPDDQQQQQQEQPSSLSRRQHPVDSRSP